MSAEFIRLDDDLAETVALYGDIEPPEVPVQRITVESWQTFNNNSQYELEFLINDLWPAKSFTFIASPPKKGKTWLGLAAALAIATGKTFISEFDIPTPRRVLYLALEGARPAIRARIGALARGLQLDPDADELDNLDISYRPRGINLADEQWASEVAQLAEEGGYAAIFVDVLRNAARIKESDSSEFSKLRGLLEPALSYTSIALLHHFTKLNELTKERTPAERMSGSGAMYGALDVGIFITGSEDHARKLRVEFDGRDIAMPDPISVYLEGSGTGPNGSLIYTDTAFWRGDIPEVEEDNVAVPSVVVVDIVRNRGPIKRSELIEAVEQQLPDATRRTIIDRIERLANSHPPTLIRPARGTYALRETADASQYDEAHAHDAHDVQCANEPHEQAKTNAHAHDAHPDAMGDRISLNHAGLRDAQHAHPYGIDAASVRRDAEPDDDLAYLDTIAPEPEELD